MFGVCTVRASGRYQEVTALSFNHPNANEWWVIPKRGCPLTSFSSSLFRAAGLTCSMMLHFQIQTFIFHQSFLSYEIKKTAPSYSVAAETSNFWFFICYPCAGWTRREILYKELQFLRTWSRQLWLYKWIFTLWKLSVFISNRETVEASKWWASVVLVFVFLSAAAARHDPHSLNPPKDVTVKSATFHYPVF